MEFDPFKYPISKLNKLTPAKGRVLISEPFMIDQYFKRSVVYLAEHADEGTVGFMLNKELDIQIDQILEEFPKFDAPVYMGGPVQPQNLFFIHTKGEMISESIEIEEGIYWNGNFDELKEYISMGVVTKNDVKFFLGYSGWDNGQLEDEMKENSWLVQVISKELLLSETDEDLWKKVIKESNSLISPMADFPEDPSLN